MEAVSWPLRVAEAEGAVAGYDTLALRGGEATLEIERPQPELLPAESGMTPEGFQVAFTGLPGWRFVVETTEDLQAWTSLATVPAEGNTVRVLDPVLPTSNRRFYRVRLAE